MWQPPRLTPHPRTVWEQPEEESTWDALRPERDRFGRPIQAINRDDLEAVVQWLADGGNVNAPDEQGETLLMQAAAWGDDPCLNPETARR